MQNLQLNPGGLRVTENCFLDIKKFKGVVDGINSGEKFDPISCLCIGGDYYIVNGHHRAYAYFSKEVRSVEVRILESDSESQEFGRSKLPYNNNLISLIAKCISDNNSSRELGLEYICDYSNLQPSLAGIGNP